jgi:hypothetical protein
MMKSAMIFLFLLTFNIVSAGQQAIVPGQNDQLFWNSKNQSPDCMLTFTRLNLDKYLESSNIPCLKNYVTQERQVTFTINPAAPVLQPIRNAGNKTRSTSGGPVKDFTQKNLSKLYCILYVEDIYPSWASSGSAKGIADDPNHFVSYYPGLLNEKIL